VSAPYIDAALKARISARRSSAPIGGRSSQSIRFSGPCAAPSGHSRLALSAIERVAISPDVSYRASTT
jgi:hypothetical protein